MVADSQLSLHKNQRQTSNFCDHSGLPLAFPMPQYELEWKVAPPDPSNDLLKIRRIQTYSRNCLLVSTYVVCERLSVMHEPAGVVEILVQILPEYPYSEFQNTPPPNENCQRVQVILSPVGAQSFACLPLCSLKICYKNGFHYLNKIYHIMRNFGHT